MSEQLRDNLEQLRTAVGLLQQAYERARQEIGVWYDGDPLRAQTPDGRPILLDALTALVNAQTALVQAERQ